MRKVVIALIIVLPMVFVLAIFSSLNLVSLSVPVSVSGIRIYADGDLLPEGDAMYVDMADLSDHKVTAQVEPANASEQGYTLSTDNQEVLTVNDEGYLTALGEGTANVTATSKDKGFRATVPVVVTSSKPYDVTFALFNSDGETVPMSYNASTGTYTVGSGLPAGTYNYTVGVKGGDASEYTLTSADEQTFVNKGEQSIFAPFSGRAQLDLNVDDAIVNNMLNQTLRRHVVFNVNKAQSTTGIVVNGVPDGNIVLVAKGATQTTLYVECEGEPQVTGDGIVEVRCRHNEQRAASNPNNHVLQVVLSKDFSATELNATISANGKQAPIKMSFADFDFRLRSGVALTEQAGMYNSVILKNTNTTFYAVAAADLPGVSYVWTTDEDNLTLTYEGDGASCVFVCTDKISCVVSVQAVKDGEPLGAPKQLHVEATAKINSIWVNNKLSVDLTERYTVGGQRYGANGALQDNDYALDITVTKKGAPLPVKNDFEDIVFECSNPSVAEVTASNGKQLLLIKGTGAVTVTVKWKYNELFGGNAVQSFNLNVVSDAVAVGNYPELRKATEAGLKVVLTRSIMLGTDETGEPLSLEERKNIVSEHTYKSTYNTEFYSVDANHSPSDAYVKYAMEFKADVYGNGFDINAEYIANGVDGTGTPAIFRGPLVFVEYKVAASVAGQDNIAFLVRTDGVTLYGVNLLGCSDSSLFEQDSNGNAVYQLNNLNKLGTTLEINSDCRVVNCRIRNGRTTLRIYGGNSDGNNYFTSAIPSTDVSDRDRINVIIDGCVITQGREFLVKIGANKALRANNANGQEPQLRDERGNVYAEQTKTVKSGTFYTNNYNVGDIGQDSFFYKRYVMTDVTLRNTVLETSGLFCVGVESNFSGELLYEGVSSAGDVGTYAKVTSSWRKSGGTSFASILRLEGDVRTYDWKDISLVDSSTLIEPTSDDSVLSDMMKFDISAMLKAVNDDESYAKLLYKKGSDTFVHGGIAFYGGGRNYSQIVLNLDDGLNNFEHVAINIGQFVTVEDNAVVKRQAQLLPYAAGTHDFNFWMYSADGANNYDAQLRDTNNGTKYNGVAKVPLF